MLNKDLKQYDNLQLTYNLEIPLKSITITDMETRNRYSLKWDVVNLNDDDGTNYWLSISRALKDQPYELNKRYISYKETIFTTFDLLPATINDGGNYGFTKEELLINLFVNAKLWCEEVDNEDIYEKNWVEEIEDEIGYEKIYDTELEN